MRKVITIDIPKPCSENWDKMTANEKGRHCASCQKTVFDFTTKTDEQIVKSFELNNNICGRFKTNQLNRDIVLSRKEKNSYATFLASGLFAFIGLGSQYTHSQKSPDLVEISSVKPKILIGKIAPPVVKDSVFGIVVDTDKLPLPGVNIMLKGTKMGAVTDFDGKFSIKANAGDVLILSYIGFKKLEFEVSEKTQYQLTLEMTEDVMGELIAVVGGAVINSTYVCSPEELERKRQNKFSRSNGLEFYKKQREIHRQNVKNGTVERTFFGKLLYKLTQVFS